MINISCHSRNYGPDSADNTLRFIHKLGYEFVNVDGEYTTHHRDAAKAPAQTAEILCDLLKKHELTPVEYVGGALSAGEKTYSVTELPVNLYSEACEYFGRVCRFAQLAGFESVMATPGDPIPGEDEAVTFARAGGLTAELTKIAKDNGVILNIEPCQRSIINSPQKAFAMLEHAPELRYTLDPLQFRIRGISMEEIITLLPYSGHLHARQTAPGWNKCPIEFGDIDFDLIIKRMRGMRWNGTITTEFWLTPPEIEAKMHPVEQTILMRYALKRMIKKYN